MKAEYVSIDFINRFLEDRRDELTRIDEMNFSSFEDKFIHYSFIQGKISALESLLDWIDYVDSDLPNSPILK